MKLRSQVEITCERSFIKSVGYYVSVATCLITGTLNSFEIAAYIFEKKLRILICRKMSPIKRLRVLTLSQRLWLSASFYDISFPLTQFFKRNDTRMISEF